MPMKWNGRPIHHAAVTRLMWTDASDFAWGAVLYEGSLSAVDAERPGLVRGVRTHGQLSAEHRKDSITVNELRAVIWSLETFLPQVSGTTCASVLHSVLVEDRRRIRPAPSQRRSG